MGASDLKIIPYSHINYVERLQTAKESPENLHDDFHYFSHFLYVFLSSFRSVARRNGRTADVAWLPRRAQCTLIRRKKLRSVSVLGKNSTEMGISAPEVDDEEENVLFALQLESAQLDHGI